MSQKLTLGYAALVGVGGLTGYLKGGSQKLLVAGGLSASLLYYVCSLLPSKPCFGIFAWSYSVCFSSGIDGFSLQEVGKDLSGWHSLLCITCHDGWLFAWYFT